jgi:hypothetical protein
MNFAHFNLTQQTLGFLDTVLERSPQMLRMVIDEFCDIHRPRELSNHQVKEPAMTSLGQEPVDMPALAQRVMRNRSLIEQCYVASLREQLGSSVMDGEWASANLTTRRTPAPVRISKEDVHALVLRIEKVCQHELNDIAALLYTLDLASPDQSKRSPISPMIFVNALRDSITQVMETNQSATILFRGLSLQYALAMRYEYLWCLGSLKAMYGFRQSGLQDLV